jgi:hypothetical protein
MEEGHIVSSKQLFEAIMKGIYNSKFLDESCISHRAFLSHRYFLLFIAQKSRRTKKSALASYVE